MIYHIYHPQPDPKFDYFDNGRFFYVSISRELWAASICWIIFACHQLKSGGALRRLLSNPLWQPFSKLCLSVYLVHFIYIELTQYDRTQSGPINVWWEIHIHIGDIFISLLFGTIFYLMLEAPAARIIQMIFKEKTKLIQNELPFKKMENHVNR
jgi:peptidoglycan/LPS O-acetylase OafA/YrhL